jgi:predicted ribosomally synthesized peptide with SipW-like signal peptide
MSPKYHLYIWRFIADTFHKKLIYKEKIMKKIILSLATIAVVSTMAVGATRAYFSSEVAVNGNTFSTGTLHITDTSVDWMQPVIFTNVKPGDVIRKWVRITNDGNMDVTLTVSANTVVDTSNFLGQVAGWTYGQIEGSSDDVNGVQTGYNDHLLTLLAPPGVTLLSPGNPVLHPGQTTKTQVQFIVPTTMGNDFQHVTASFNLVYHAEQLH